MTETCRVAEYVASRVQRPGPAVLGGRVGTARGCRARWSAQDGGDGAVAADGGQGKKSEGLVQLFVIYLLFPVVFGVSEATAWVLG